MNKIQKTAQYFQKKLSQMQENYSDINWLQQLAKEFWQQRNKMESAVSKEDAFKVLRYLQSIYSVTNHLVSSAKSSGMSQTAAKKYQDALRIAIHGLASVPGLTAWDEWFQSFNNSLDNYQPRQFLPKYKQTKEEPSGAPYQEPQSKKEEAYPMPPGLFPENKPDILPYPLGVKPFPGDQGPSGYVPDWKK